MGLQVRIDIYEGESRKATDNKLLDTFTLSGIPPLPAGEPRILVRFKVDFDGTLSASAHDKTPGKFTIKSLNVRQTLNQILHINKSLQLWDKTLVDVLEYSYPDFHLLGHSKHWEMQSSMTHICFVHIGGGNSTKATLKVTRGNQAEEAQDRTKMIEDQVGFKANAETRLRVAKARKDLFKYASDRKHKALLRQVIYLSLLLRLGLQDA